MTQTESETFRCIISKNAIDTERIYGTLNASPRLLVDSYTNVLTNMFNVIGLSLIIPFISIVLLEDSLAQNPGTSVFWMHWFNLLISWYSWTDPLNSLFVLVTLSIALQLAVHTMRLQQNSIGIQGESQALIAKNDVGRAKLFSSTASLVGACAVIFTLISVIDMVIHPRSDTNASTVATILIVGIVAALLCIDAGRITTSQELQKRLPTAIESQTVLHRRLRGCMRDLSSARLNWITSIIEIGIIAFITGLILVRSTSPSISVEERSLAGIIAITIMLFLFMAFIFVIVLMGSILMTLMDVGRGKWVIFYLLTGLCVSIIISVVERGNQNPAFSFVIISSITVLFFSMMLAEVQNTRKSSSVVTRASFGLHGLLRLYVARFWNQRTQRSDAHVAWIQQSLAGPPSPASLTAHASEKQSLLGKWNDQLAGWIKRG